MAIAGERTRKITVSERLAEHVVATRFEDLPGAVVERTKDLLVHQLALAFEGRSTAEGRRAVALAYELSAGGGGSTIVGQRRPATLLDAIFAHAVISTADNDDFQLPSGLHLGRSAHAVAWVLGERERSSGRELITAVVVGYDVACKLALPQLLRSYQHRPQHAFAPFASTAIATRLLRHDLARAAQAISHAAHVGMGVVEGGDGPSASALTARDAVMAALLARAEGGAPPTIEGTHGLYRAFYGSVPDGLEANLATLGREYAMLGASTKRYPSSASHIVPLELTRELVERTGVRASDVTALVATLGEDFRGRFGYMEAGIDRPDPSEYDTIRSLRLKLTTLLVDGAIDPLPTPARFKDAAVQALLPKVRLDFEAGRPLDWARIEIAARDGRALRSEGTFTPYPKGDWAAWIRKDGERFLSASRLTLLEGLLTHLEDVPDVGEVLRATIPDRAET